MKKIGFNFILQILFGFLGMVMVLCGIFMTIASFFIPAISLFQGVVFVALGAILFSCVGIYFKFQETLNAAADGLEKITNATKLYKEKQDGGFSHLTGVQEIHIDENTSPEEIQKIKEMHPGMKGLLDELMKSTKPYNKEELPSDLELMSSFQLQKELQKAIDSENYERAQAIRNEISKR